MPEITVEARRVILLIIMSVLIAFLFMVWIFAFYM